METAPNSELPPPRVAPLSRQGPAFGRLSRRQRAAARALLGHADAFVILPTGTRVDVGSWLGASRVCAAALAEHLLLFALEKNPLIPLLRRVGLLAQPGLRAGPFVQRIPFSDLRRSTYNHVTGKLVLAPAGRARVRTLKLAPLDAYQLLAQIHHATRDTRNA